MLEPPGHLVKCGTPSPENHYTVGPTSTNLKEQGGRSGWHTRREKQCSMQSSDVYPPILPVVPVSCGTTPRKDHFERFPQCNWWYCWLPNSGTCNLFLDMRYDLHELFLLLLLFDLWSSLLITHQQLDRCPTAYKSDLQCSLVSMRCPLPSLLNISSM